MSQTILHYVHDPMCSWCYAFRPVWQQIIRQLPDGIEVQHCLGGLAADSIQVMPIETQQYIQGQWHKILQEVPGTVFDFSFWETCEPRRSTYPACRAVWLARQAGCEMAMIHAIQDAYYRQARNPSDTETLCDLAAQLGLDSDEFTERLHASATRQALHDEIRFVRSIGGSHFPSLFLQHQQAIQAVPLHYNDAQITLNFLEDSLL